MIVYRLGASVFTQWCVTTRFENNGQLNARSAYQV